MIELEIFYNDNIISLNISKENNIIYKGKQEIMKLFRLFDLCLNDKEENIKIKIGNRIINSKEYTLINLLDISSVIDSLKFKKNNLIFDYLNNFIEEIDDEKLSEFTNYIENFFRDFNNKLCFKYSLSFDGNLTKLFSNNIEFLPYIEESEYEEKLNIILKEIIDKKIDKKFLIFLDSSYISVDLKENDNIFVFDVSQEKDILKYNIIINNEIEDFNPEIVLDNLKINWPLAYTDDLIINNFDNFMKYYYKKSNLFSNNENDLIVATILNKYYDLNIKLIYDNSKIDNIVTKFITTF